MLDARKVLCGLIGCAWMAGAPCGVAETPRFRVTGVAEGLPSSSINAIARDHAGYVWVATPDGLARYDGIGVRVWRHEPGNPDALPGNNVQALHVDAQDRVWVATEGGGLDVLDAQRRHFRHYRMAGDPAIGSDDTWAIASRDGVLWFGTYGGGLHRLGRDGRITRFMPGHDDPRSLPADTVMSLAFDARGALWIGTTAGVARWNGRGLERVALPGKTPAPIVFSLNVDGDAMWAGTSTGVFRRGPDGRWVAPSWSPMFERPNAMMAIARGRDGQFWIGSQRGLWRTRADGIPAPVHGNGPGIAKAVQSLLLQEDDALWAPVPGEGLGYLRPGWRQLAQFARSADGLSGDIYRAIAPASRGGVWLASASGAPERLGADGTVERMSWRPPASLRGVKYTAVVEDARGATWLAYRQGLVRIDAHGRIRQWREGGDDDGTLSGQTDLLRIAPDGTLWLSCAGAGMQQRDVATGRVLRNVPAGTHGLGAADVEALAFAADGRPWIAGDRGVARWDAARQGFEWQATMGSGRVHALAFDGADTLWLARVTGIERYRRNGQQWRHDATVGVAQGMPAVEAAGMQVDRMHRVWLATMRGLFRWDGASRRVRHFGVQDGLGSQEFLDRVMTLTDTGVLAAATSDGGVVLLDTTASEPVALRPELRIDQVAVRRDGHWQALPADAAIELSPDERELRVRARLLAYEDPQGNRYDSRLEGFDHDWVAQGPRGERVFSGLAPGRYRMRLRARDTAGTRSPEQVLGFRVLPPWWRAPWALAAFAVIGAALLWSVAAVYRTRLRQRNAWQLAERTRELAEHASQAKTHFLATLGHEVRTPMTGVLGMSELLLGTPLDPRQRGYTESIRSAGNHLLRLVDDALDLARIEAGKLELDAQAFALRELVADVVGLMAPVAQRCGLRFDTGIAADVPDALHGDPLRIRQVLLNLLGNAIKFTGQGSVDLQVSMPSSSVVRFEVRDTGPGLSVEQQSRLFRRFEQAEGSRTAARYGGSGLGLAICQQLAMAMGGRIEVESAPGRGARFQVDLPLPAATTAGACGGTPITPVANRSLDLLLVEDDAIVAEVMTGLLRAWGHRVTHAGHGLTAIAEAANKRFDAALLDLDLPGMDGLALARLLRTQGFEAPLLAVTARADADVESQSRAAGFDGFLRKPLTGAMLAQAVEELLPAAK